MLARGKLLGKTSGVFVVRGLGEDEAAGLAERCDLAVDERCTLTHDVTLLYTWVVRVGMTCDLVGGEVPHQSDVDLGIMGEHGALISYVSDRVTVMDTVDVKCYPIFRIIRPDGGVQHSLKARHLNDRVDISRDFDKLVQLLESDKIMYGAPLNDWRPTAWSCRELGAAKVVTDSDYAARGSCLAAAGKPVQAAELHLRHAQMQTKASVDALQIRLRAVKVRVQNIRHNVRFPHLPTVEDSHITTLSNVRDVRARLEAAKLRVRNYWAPFAAHPAITVSRCIVATPKHLLPRHCLFWKKSPSSFIHRMPKCASAAFTSVPATHTLTAPCFHTLQAQLATYLAHEHDVYSTSQDAITGLPLDATKHLVSIGLRNVFGATDFEDMLGMRAAAKDAHDLAQRLADPSHRELRVLCIMTAGAGTGKTNFARQLMHALCTPGGSSDVLPHFVPVFVPMQRLARLLGGEASTSGGLGQTGDPVVRYIHAAYADSGDAECSGWGRMLLAMRQAGRLFPIFDGLDEVPELRDEVAAAVTQESHDRLHRCLLTTRPEGMGSTMQAFVKAQEQRHRVVATASRRADQTTAQPLLWTSTTVFVYDLKPLAKEQQTQILRTQLPNTGTLSAGYFVERLFQYVESRQRFDELCSRLDQDALRHLADIPSFDRTRGVGGIVQVTAQMPLPPVADTGRGTQAPTSSQGSALRPVATAAELLAVAAAARGTIKQRLEAVAAGMDLPVVAGVAELQDLPGAAGLVFVPLKKKERIVEKMANNAGKANPPPAYIMDAVRATAAVPTAEAMVQFYEALNDPGQGMVVVRLKNYFCDVDETHYRRLQCVVKVLVPPEPGQPETGLYHLAEVQIQLAAIYDFRNKNLRICREPYDYFRTLFSGGLMKSVMNEGAGGWMSLDVVLTAWADLFNTPVVLAMFVRLLASIDFSKPETIRLPTTKAALYAVALGTMAQHAACALAPAVQGPTAAAGGTAPSSVGGASPSAATPDQLLGMLAAVACDNQLGDVGDIKRIFSQRDAEAALAGSPGHLELLVALINVAGSNGMDEYRVPGCKVLESSSGGSGVLLQATHLSFQEYLAAQHLTKHPAKARAVVEAHGGGVKFLQGQRNLATFVPVEAFNAWMFGELVEFKAERAGLGPEVGAAIGRALEKNTTLREINLWNNNLGDEGGAAIGRALEKNTTLQEINLRDNKLGAASGVAIGRALDKNTTLQQINLENNKLGAEGWAAIGRALESNTTLQQIDLENNNLGAASGAAIGRALDKNTALQKIFLGDNGFEMEAKKYLLESCAVGSQSRLNFDNHKFQEAYDEVDQGQCR